MKNYLLKEKIPSKNILLDTSAVKTTDTCRYLKTNYSQNKKLIFISQGYHLPRIKYQCEKIGVAAELFPAETLQQNRKSLFSSFEVLTIRTTRYFREAGLTLLAVIDVYK